MVVKHFDTQNPRFAAIKSSSSPNQSIPCLFGEVKGKRLLVEAEAPVTVSTTITVEYDDSLFLGEVITCKQANGVFTLEVKVEQVLSGLQSLMALRARLLSDAPASAPSVSPFSQAFACR
jgi:hypothetical protein